MQAIEDLVIIQKSALMDMVRQEVEKVHVFYQERDEMRLLELSRQSHDNTKLQPASYIAHVFFADKVAPETIYKNYVRKCGLKCYTFRGQHFYDPRDVDQFLRNKSKKEN